MYLCFLFVILYVFTVCACGAPDKVMATSPPKPKPDLADPDAGTERMFAWISSVANWLFACTVIVVALGLLLHNCGDFTPWISR